MQTDEPPKDVALPSRRFTPLEMWAVEVIRKYGPECQNGDRDSVRNDQEW